MGKKKSNRNNKHKKKDVQSANQRQSALRETRDTVADVPQPPSGLPNPRLCVKNTTECNHGCQIVTQGRVYDILYLLIAGLNGAITGALGTVECARELTFRAKSFAGDMHVVKDFDKIWYGGDGSEELAVSLLSIGTDLLLIDGGVCKEGKLKMAGAITGMVQSLAPVTRDKEVTISARKDFGTMNGGEREVVGFFHKRISCDCLKSKYEMLKGTQEKMGRCDCCMKFFELKELRQCSTCKFVQYCSELCQRIHWSEHKEMCQIMALSSLCDVLSQIMLETTEILNGESETDESAEDIYVRLWTKKFQDPVYRRKYGHLLDDKKLDEQAEAHSEETATE